MFDDILVPKKKKGTLMEPGVYTTLDCDGGCGKSQTFKQTKVLTVKWKCAICCNENEEDCNV